MRAVHSCVVSCIVTLGQLVASPAIVRAAESPPSATGSLSFDGEAIALPYVYVYAREEGFYDPADPTWTIVFIDRELAERDVDDLPWDASYLELGITSTTFYDENAERQVQVYSQSFRPSADYGGNMSGGDYPEIDLQQAGPERFTGRVYHAEPVEFLDHTIQVDFTFDAPLSDPDAPIGDPLPADGGEPGRAWVAWTEAVRSGDLDRLKALAPPELAAQLEGEEAQEALEFMQIMTPGDVKILSGSSDGSKALLTVEGVMEGEKVTGEVMLEKQGDFWLATSESWE